MTARLNHILLAWMAVGIFAVAFSACENDDTDFSQYINAATGGDGDDDNGNTPATGGNDTIYIAYNGTTASATGNVGTVVSVSDADVIVSSTSTNYMVLVLSGQTSNGSLLVYREKKFEIILNGVSITNPDGPAINNQCGKSLFVNCAEGTVNTLTDGTAYAEKSYDQKGTLFSEGQIYFRGTGQLTVNGNCKNAIASDDYITVEDGSNLTIVAKGTNGLKANDGVFIVDGTLNINVTSDGGRGIRSEARTVVSGGNTTINTSGDCLIETVGGVPDTTSAAGIKSDSLFTMTAGQLTITSSGDGGKGINCSENVELSGGTLTVSTTGSNDSGKPKAVKSQTGIVVSGGSFSASVKKSWACDNGTDSEDPADRVTIVGTPATKTLTKRSVVISY